MNKKSIVLSCTLALAAAGPLFSQEPPPPPPQDAPPPPHSADAPPPRPDDARPGRRGPGAGPMAGIDQADREKLKAAHEKAMQDPKVKAAREKQKAAAEEFAKVVRPLAMKEDKSIEPILDKMDKTAAENPQGGQTGAGAARPGGGRGPMGNLTPAEREKMRALHEKLKDDPEYKAAAEKRRAADQELREATRNAMLAADPSLQPVLDKMDKARSERRGGPGGGGGQPPKGE